MVERVGAAEIYVQVDEVGPGGNEIRPGQPGRDTRRKQQWGQLQDLALGVDTPTLTGGRGVTIDTRFGNGHINATRVT